MQQHKKEARQMWKSGRATKSKASVARNGLQGRIAEIESTEDGRMMLAGWGTAACIVALLAFILVDMATGGAL